MYDLICSETGTTYPGNIDAWRSEAGAPFDLDFRGDYDPVAAHKRPATLWRYREALPIAGEHVVTLGEGMTPLLPLELAGRTVSVKCEFLLPTGSYKDRGSTVLLTALQQQQARHVINDSSGNAGASVACYAARAGIPCDIYVPAGNTPGKLLQIKLYGARLQEVPGSREDSTVACMAAVQGETRYASHVWNPYFVHGCKTYVYELFEQLGGTLPDGLVFPIGNGALLLGSWLALQELKAGGHIDRYPRLMGVQAANVAPLAAAFANQTATDFAPTSAEGIAVRAPARAEQMLAAIRATDGTIWTVAEDEIKTATLHAAARGLLIEPTSATTLAAVQREQPEGDLVLALTGNGLKASARLGEWSAQ